MSRRRRFSLWALLIATVWAAAGVVFLIPRALSVRQNQFALSAVYGQSGVAIGRKDERSFCLSCDGTLERRLWRAAWWDDIDTIFFQTIIDFRPRPPTEKQLAAIRKLPTLRRVEVYNPISPELYPALSESAATIFVVGGGLPGDDAIARLAGARHMREFIIPGGSTPSITPEGLVPLAKSKTLKVLRIRDMPSFGDAAIPALEKFDQLDELELRGTGISAAGLKRLRESLPRTKVLETTEADAVASD